MRASVLLLLLAGCAELRSDPRDAEPDASVVEEGTPDAGLVDASPDRRQAGQTGSVKGGPPCRTDDACAKLPIAVLSTATIATRNDYGAVSATTVENRLAVHRYAANPTAQPSAQVGPCVLWRGIGGTAGPPPEPYAVLDANLGSVTVDGAITGEDVFNHVSDGADPGYVSSLSPLQLPFLGGEQLTLQATGSADFPGVHLGLTAPKPIMLGLPPLGYVPGDGYGLTWNNPSNGEVTLTLTTHLGSSTAIAICSVPDSGSYTVPAEVTALLYPTVSGAEAVLHIDRVVAARAQPGTVLYEWRATTSDERTLYPH